MNRYLACGLVAAAAAFAPAIANAFPCGISRFLDNEASGDNHYGALFACRQDLINFWWEQYDFDQGDWDEGFGYEDPCGYESPLARTFHALHALHYSDANPPPRTDDFGGTILRWAGNYANREIDELDAECRFDTTSMDFRTPLDDYTELYPAFFYDMTVPERAGTLLHEARHASGNDHLNTPCPRRGSCDPDWAYNGSNTFEVSWLWHYAVNGVLTTEPLRRRARDRANHVLDAGYTTHPGFHVYTAEDRGDVLVATSRGGDFYGAGGKWHDWFCINNEICEVADVNGDGKDDLVAFSRGDSGDVWVALGTGSGFYGSGWKWHDWFCIGEQTCMLGDANGDNKDDLIVFDKGSSGKVWVALSNGSSFNGGAGQWHDWFCVGGQVCEVGDVNGDNKDDLIAFDRGNSGKVWVALSSGGNFFGGGGQWHHWFCVGEQVCKVGDANGDRKDDLIVFDRGSTGKVWTALSSGGNFYGGEGQWHNWFCIYNQQCEVGDANGDGKDDLIVFDRQASGDVWVTLSRGYDFFGGGGMWHDKFCFVNEVCRVGDVTGDGKADLLTFPRQ